MTTSTLNREAQPLADTSGTARTGIVGLLARHAEHSSAMLSVNHGTQHFLDGEGLIAYRPAGRKFLITVAGVTAPRERRAAVLDAFLGYAAGCGRKVIGVQLLREDAELFAARGFRVNQLGASYSIPLAKHTLAGTRFMKLRNKISRARRLGIDVQELGVDQPIDSTVIAELNAIDRSWLQAKGRHVKELAFLIGEIGDLNQWDRSLKRLFVARQENRIIAYILYTASFGSSCGWMHDLTRRVADAPVGVMELINSSALERFKKEKVKYLHLGFTPLTSLDPQHEIEGASSNMAAKVFRLLAEHGSAIYPSKDQLQYKLKWAPEAIYPEYIAFQNGFSLRGLWAFLRVTHAI